LPDNESSEVALVFERDNAASEKPSQVLSEQASDSSVFLNVTCILKYTKCVEL
jgi:hypothetical protein